MKLKRSGISMHHPKDRKPAVAVKSIVSNQDGSIIVIAMVVLALMTIIGISVTNTTVTESAIVRNVAVYKQNMAIVENATIEAMAMVQGFLNNMNGNNAGGVPANIDPTTPFALNWVHTRTDFEDQTKYSVAPRSDAGRWYSLTTSAVLNQANAAIPLAMITPDLSDGIGLDNLLAARDEFRDSPSFNPANIPLHYALIGWDYPPSNSLKATGSSRKVGRLLTEYASGRYGMVRMEAGIKVIF